jgi:hypothetical protein
MAEGKKLTKKSGKGLSASHEIVPSLVPPALLGDLQSLIDATRIRVAVGINTEMVLLYWDIGERIRSEILGNERAAYGKQVVNTVSDQLTMQYGTGFTRTNLFNMIRFAEIFPDRSIIHTLCGQLSWSHFRCIIYIEDSLAREFYTEICRLELWSVRTLQAKIQGMLFERTALSKKPDELARKELAALRVEPECDGVIHMSKKETAHPLPGEPDGLDLPSLVRRIEDIHYHLVERATKAVNVSLTLLNWLIRLSLQNYELEGKDRAAYGERLFSKLADELTSRGVSNCSRHPLYHYQDFYLAYPHIVGSLHPQLQNRLIREGIRTGNERESRSTYIQTGCPFEVRA